MGRRYSTKIVLQDAAQASGNGTPANVAGLGNCVVQVSGTFSARVNLEGTIDNVTWYQLAPTVVETGAAGGGTTVPILWSCDTRGLALVRAPVADYVSGSVTVTLLSNGGA